MEAAMTKKNRASGNDDEGVGQKGPERLAEQGEGRAQGTEHDSDAGDVGRGKQECSCARRGTTRAEDADGDGNHRVHARRERSEKSRGEREDEGVQGSPTGRGGEIPGVRRRGQHDDHGDDDE